MNMNHAYRYGTEKTIYVVYLKAHIFFNLVLKPTLHVGLFKVTSLCDVYTSTTYINYGETIKL